MKKPRAGKGTNGSDAPGARTNGRANGHSNGFANGHASEYPLRSDSSCAPLAAAAAGETPHIAAQSRGRFPLGGDAAASDDARGATVAGAASPCAACPDREACAEAALAGKLPRQKDTVRKKRDKTEERFAASTGAKPADELAPDAPSFVEEMHRLVNLYAIGKRLLESEDEKVVQRAWEHLMEMHYGKDAAANDEPPRIDFGDLAKPDRQV